MKLYKTEKIFIIFFLIGLITLLFIILPIAKIIFSHSPSTLYSIAKEPQVQNAIWLSIYASFLTSIIACLLGTPLAYLLARKNFFGKSIVEAIIDLPLAVPHTVAGIAILMIFGRKQFIGSLFNEYLDIRFVGTLGAVILGMLFVSMPFMINSAREGFESINYRVELAARTLGASQFEIFRRVSLPLAKRGIFTGMILTWARSISEFGAVFLLAYYVSFWNPLTMEESSAMTAPVLIADQFLQYGLERSSSIAALLLIVCLTLFIILRTLTGGKK
ncbi:MAG TPA: ABC transporter permease subunit [Methanosarcinales archaeon]|nr:ABC transporter permease subunit [Methanosarcinales archaeon]